LHLRCRHVTPPHIFRNLQLPHAGREGTAEDAACRRAETGFDKDLVTLHGQGIHIRDAHSAERVGVLLQVNVREEGVQRARFELLVTQHELRGQHPALGLGRVQHVRP
jgi:hypothetical protein